MPLYLIKASEDGPILIDAMSDELMQEVIGFLSMVFRAPLPEFERVEKWDARIVEMKVGAVVGISLMLSE